MLDRQGINQKSTIPSWQVALNAERFLIATKVLPIMIGGAAVLGVFFVAVYFWLGRPWQWLGMIAEAVVAMVLFVPAYVLARRGRLVAAVYLTVVALSLSVILGSALVEGMVVPGIPVGVLIIVFARLLVGRMENRVVVLISGVAMMIGAVLAGFRVFEILPIPAWVQVVITAGVVVTIVFLTALILDLRDVRYESSLAAAEAYATEVDAHRVSLEERGSALERRARYLEATAEVAREVTSVLDMPELLARVVTLISERFGFYHIGLFLLDPGGEWAVLQAASSAGGQQMLARGHRLKIGEVGIVSYVIGQGEQRIALDVGTDAMFFNNPDLPETRSEMALPLRARGEVIGALDVQSREPAAFTEEDAAVLQTLADQVAMAIGNARLFEQVQQSMEAERRAYGELSRQAWSEVSRARPGLGYRYEKGSAILPVEHPMSHSERGKAASERRSESTEALPELTLPVKVREHTIATVNAHKPGGAGNWTSEEVELMKTLTEQLSVALESARLYQDTQRRAARERTIGEVTSRIRETLDMEAMLRTATEQICQTLGLEDLVVRLIDPESVKVDTEQT